MSSPEHPIFARLYDPIMQYAEQTILREHREFLAADLSGRVLDVGAGTGAMFPYLSDAVAADAVSLVAIEPDPHMRTRASERAKELNLDVQLDDVSAENLPYDDSSFDVVIASFVFCTIPDVDSALSEIARVLEPGGEFRFVEHVRAAGLAGSVQDLIAPCWYTVGGGCHPNRETGERFLRDDRFKAMEFTRSDSGVSTVFPVVRGTLVRKANPKRELILPSL